MAIVRLSDLMQQAGELTPAGQGGILLPPFGARFLADELGCRPAQVQEILEQLVLDGVFLIEGERLVVPDPRALLDSSPSSRASPGA